MIGWWAIPLILSIWIGGYAWSKLDRRPAYDFGVIGQTIGNALITAAAIFPILLIWLVYFIIF